MNLAEIRQRIFDQMDFNPNLQQYRDSVVRRINDHYLQICDSAHWLFLQKESTIQLRKEVVGSATMTIRVETSNLRKVTITGGTFTSEMEGQTFINTDTNKEFKIVRVYDTTNLYIDSSFDGTTGTALQTFKIRFDRQALPSDCIEVLGYVDRDDDRGRLFQIERKREEYAYLDRDNSGDPFVIVDDEAFEGLAPISALGIATSATSGTLVNNTTYEYQYTIYYEGREGPPSQIASINTSSRTSIALSAMDNTSWYPGAATSTRYDSGIAKYLYRRDKTNDGQWMLIKILESTTTTYTDSALYPDVVGYLNQSNYSYNSLKDYIHFDECGFRQYVRFWYAPSTDRDIHIRYHRRPRNLVNDNDSPVFPKQYHTILVYATLEDMFLQMQATDQAQIFRARKLQLIDQMRKRYLSRDDTRKRFSRFDRRKTRLTGDAVTDFTGAN